VIVHPVFVIVHPVFVIVHPVFVIVHPVFVIVRAKKTLKIKALAIPKCIKVLNI
jgi:hypothetical protein